MSFPAEFIDRVRDSSDIIEVIGQYVTLKKRGANYLGLCPFHAEKTPSFTVTPAKAMYKCFGCGAGGNVFTFIMQREKLQFPEAVEFLAKRLGIEIPRQTSLEQQSRREKLFAAALIGHRYFREMYKIHPEGAKYLASRHFNPAIAEKMEIGLAPDSWDGFAKTLRSGFSDYATVGLLRERQGGGHYDYFRNRVMFPIKDLSGRVCAFGGRILGKEDENNAKYLNSPENPIYTKGTLLYGLSNTRDAIRKAGFAYLVEGYTDLLRLIASGVENGAAGLGTALTPQQAKLMHRYTDKVVLLYDGDSAGCNAAVKAGRILSSAGVEVEVSALPPEDDPDTFVLNNGAEGLKKAPLISLLKFHLRMAGGVPKDRIEREKLAKEMLESAVHFQGEMKKSLALEEISEMLSIPTPALRSELMALKRNMPEEKEDETQAISLNFAPSELPERDLIRLLIFDPGFGEDAFTKINPEIFANPALKSLYSRMKTMFLQGKLKDAHSLISEFDDTPTQNFIAECAISEPPWEIEVLLKDNIAKLREKSVKRKAAALKQRIKEAEARGEDTKEFLIALSKIKAEG